MSPDAVSDHAWGRWLATLVIVTVGGSLFVLALIAAVDPFSTGRFALTRRIDVVTNQPAFMKAGLVRDPRFDSAIIGNSTAERLDPIRLDALTGRSFVQLALPGSAPESQIIVGRAFLRNHPASGTMLLFHLDDWWCRAEFPEESRTNFPFAEWLFESSGPEYLTRLFNPAGVEGAFQRISLWSGMRDPPARTDGFINVPPRFRPAVTEMLRDLQRPTAGEPIDARFHALDALEPFLSSIPADVKVVLVVQPKFINLLPAVGSPLAERMRACRERIRRNSQNRPHTLYLNLEVENPVTTDVVNFEDGTHYGTAVARWVEDQVTAALQTWE